MRILRLLLSLTIKVTKNSEKDFLNMLAIYVKTKDFSQCIFEMKNLKISKSNKSKD